MPPSPSPLHIASTSLTADISTLGAELQNLSDGSGQRLQWDGDPAVWAGRAPILFPVVGELAGGRYRLEGKTYALPRHGFARRSLFDVVSHDASAALLRLEASEATRAVYPFEFRLDLAFAIVDAELRMAATVMNLDTRDMPASFGFHPALCWPLPYGERRDAHRIVFDRDEPEPVRRLTADGLLRAGSRPSPVRGNVLALRDELFVDDALIFDRPASRRVTYGADHGPQLDIRFEGLPLLGVWNKPGAAFVCIEPWQGIADPEGFDGELADKPGIVVIAPGQSRTFAMTIALQP